MIDISGTGDVLLVDSLIKARASYQDSLYQKLLNFFNADVKELTDSLLVKQQELLSDEGYGFFYKGRYFYTERANDFLKTNVSLLAKKHIRDSVSVLHPDLKEEGDTLISLLENSKKQSNTFKSFCNQIGEFIFLDFINDINNTIGERYRLRPSGRIVRGLNLKSCTDTQQEYIAKSSNTLAVRLAIIAEKSKYAPIYEVLFTYKSIESNSVVNAIRYKKDIGGAVHRLQVGEIKEDVLEKFRQIESYFDETISSYHVMNGLLGVQ